MSNTYNCIYIYAIKNLIIKPVVRKFLRNTSFVSTVPWSKFCQSKLTTVYQRYEATAISKRKGLFKCTLDSVSKSLDLLYIKIIGLSAL